MAVVELKKQVKKRIESINDAYLLEEIISLLDFDSDKEEIFVIPPEHQKELEISIDQMQSKQTLSNSEVDAKVQKWLSE